MIVNQQQLEDAVATIQRLHNDTWNIEAKSMTVFSATSLGPSISSLANLPGGGTILLGVDEHLTPAVIGVPDPDTLCQQAANLCRNGFSTPISAQPRIFEINVKPVVVITIEEANLLDKPVRYLKTGKAYLRSFDGDFTMSAQEELFFLKRHERPREDLREVAGTSENDLDPDLLAAFLESVREHTPQLKEVGDQQVLSYLGVVGDVTASATEGEASKTKNPPLTVAGLYALGCTPKHGRPPQQFFPMLSVTAYVQTDGPDTTVRAINRLDLMGPIPTLLADAVQWVMTNTDSAQVVTDQGKGITVTEFPRAVIRELIVNALVHRDVSEISLARNVTIAISRRQIRITSPGGLWGVSADSLGHGGIQSAVNERLYQLCRNISGPDGRIIEALGTGIPTVVQTLKQEQLPPPRFFDQGTSFTVILDRVPLIDRLNPSPADTIPPDLNDAQVQALKLLRSGESLANGDYRSRFGVSSVRARKDLSDLVRRGLARVQGEKRGTRYVGTKTY